MQWTKVASGHYRHDETGVEIRKHERFREYGRNVGVRWHLTAPTRGGNSLTIGTARSLRTAKEWAEGSHGIIEVRRETIAKAYDEAVAEHVERAAQAAEAVGAPNWRADSARRMIGYAKTGTPGWLTSVINDVRRMEESTANHWASSPEGDAARADQLYAWGLAHSGMLYDDAFAQDHAEALVVDRAYPSGQSRNWREQVYRRAVEMDSAAPHMGHAYDSLIDEAYAEALAEDRAARMTEPGKFARGEEPYPYVTPKAGFRVGDRVSFGDDVWQVRELRINSGTGRPALTLTDPNNPNRFTSVYESTAVEWAENEAHRENAARIIAATRAPEGATGPSLPEVPADVSDDVARAAYCAALPAPTDQEIADVLAEYGDPYAAPRAAVVGNFKDAARMIWKMREAQRTAGGALDQAMLDHLRKSMRTLRGVLEIYDDLTESWRIGNRTDANRDAATQTF